MTASGSRDDSIDPLEDRTRPILPSSSISASPRPLLLERIEPSLGRGERMVLDSSRDRFSVGRAEHNDIRLYTASASREHAVIECNDTGEWILTPAGGKTVGVDGEEERVPVVLEPGLNLVMGGDHLRCLDEEHAGGVRAPETNIEAFDDGAPPSARSGGANKMTPFWWIVSCLALAGVGLILFALLGG